MSFRNTICYAMCCMLAGGMVACSVKKNTSLSRNYHNLVSHYNIYFNGSESFKRGREKAFDAVENNYNQILPVFLFEAEEVHSAVGSDMKRAVDKATKVITFHSITAKPKVKEGEQTAKDKAFFEKREYNKWVDDSYMLMGKAYMFRGDFFLAVETFKHVLVTFPNQPIRFLGMTWLARAYIMIGEQREAERILTALSDERAFPEEYLGAYHTTWAQYYMRTENYEKAAEHLTSALEAEKFSKERRIRYSYILAQLYEESEQNEKALQYYRQVTRYNPPYEMAFNAKVSMAEVFESGSSGSDELKKLLNKMLRDSKNEEYLDQIYFALGNIAAEEGNREQAIEYYQKSVSSSVRNQYQKGFSSLTLARIFYEEPDYKLSAAYYDSAVSFLSEDFPGYDNLANLSASLGGLVYNVNTYEMQDSLQMLAGLPEEERLSIIDKIIEEVRKAEEEGRLAEQQAMQNLAFNQSMLYDNNRPSGGGGTTGGGKWYFYNLNAKSFGQPEFRMKWGDRELTDNWRRKNKRSVASREEGGEVPSDTIEGESATAILDNKSREFYLADIPLSDSAMEVSHARIEEALFHMGKIYKEDLLDYDEAILAFRELLERYPNTRYAPEAYYRLYELYNTVRQEGSQSEAALYKRKLTNQFPESHFAKLLNNPNYIQELEEEEKKVVRRYEEVYELHKKGDHSGVVAQADQAMEQFPEDELVPKFMYIKALSTGSLEGKTAMKTVLDTLVARYPETEEGVQAQEIIDYMFVEFPEIKEAEEAEEAEVMYTGYDPEQEHLFLLALEESENMNQVSFDLLNYNLDHFNEYDLEMERLELGDGYEILAVSSFTNAEGAMRYLNIILENSSQILAEIPSEKYRLMVISRDNLGTLRGQDAFNPYYLFFRNHYLNQEIQE